MVLMWNNGNKRHIQQHPIKSSAYLDLLGKNKGGFFDFSLALPDSNETEDFC